MSVRIVESADVAQDAIVGDGSSVWHLAQVREGATLGLNCVVGRGAYIGTGVSLGDGCKVQNYALVYEPAELGPGVFIGPAVVLTNDHFPRAVNPDLTPKSAHDWEPVGVTILEGASIGARAVCVAPLTIGKWATVAAGAVVVKNVPDFALVVGVPARRIGWVGRAGEPLVADEENPHFFICPVTAARYEELDQETLREVTV
ncbi:acyltransferase [Galactobacter caseinivorans]|uniref:N-acetyltransferase n=1 Tax=Galactobacter caseinivorans TaxID=2676123 RepID=A0A496PN04_9MICC|nr:acyltransferase [Galactobacter caseinivorans]RKW71915.1 N-acetyltransferase [Galactobacter caseinivorans]